MDNYYKHQGVNLAHSLTLRASHFDTIVPAVVLQPAEANPSADRVQIVRLFWFPTKFIFLSVIWTLSVDQGMSFEIAHKISRNVAIFWVFNVQFFILDIMHGNMAACHPIGTHL